MTISDIATIERAKKGKDYQKGATLIQVSATRGQVIFHHGGTVDSQYAVIELKRDVRIKPMFLYLYLTYTVGRNIEALKAGLNIQINDLRTLRVEF